MAEDDGRPALGALFGLGGKRAVITGGTRGIGRLAAETFLRQGAEVLVTSRRAEAAQAAAAELGALGRAHACVADLSRADGVTALAEEVRRRFDAVHIVVNNAGATWGAPFASYPAQAWPKLLHLDVTVPFLLVQQLADLLAAGATERDPARVINIGSIDGHSAGPYENYAYGAAKAALAHLTNLLARELGPRRITVNCLALGPIRTKMTAALLDAEAAVLTASNPLRRVGEPADVVAPLLLLAGPGGSYITGATLPVDGGFAVNRWCETSPDQPEGQR